jgi:hypothetical protein
MYLAIRHRCGLRRTPTTTLPTGYLLSWGIEKDAKKRSLNVLEDAGLVAVERRTGRTARVSLKASGGQIRQPQSGN